MGILTYGLKYRNKKRSDPTYCNEIDTGTCANFEQPVNKFPVEYLASMALKLFKCYGIGRRYYTIRRINDAA